MVVIFSILLACGDKEDTSKQQPSTEPSDDVVSSDCETLSVEECGVQDSCTVILAREITVDVEQDCYSISETTIEVGCQSAGLGCTDAIVYAQDPAIEECTWFSSGCLPTGWESCEMAMEECQ